MNTIEELNLKITQMEKQIVKIMARKSAPNRDCLSEEEVAEWLGVTTKTVRRYTEEGKLIAIWPNAKRKYHAEDVKTFMRGFGKSGLS